MAHRWKTMIRAAIFATLMLCVFPQLASAAGGTATNGAADICTSFSDSIFKMQQHNLSPTGGILSDIYFFIKNIVSDATGTLFNAFVQNPNYQYAFFWSMTLMITFYGVAFTMGVVQPSFQQAFVRLSKLAVVAAVVSPYGWSFFNFYVVQFFAEGTDDLIIGIQSIALGGIPIPIGATPFWALDNVAQVIVDPDTIIALVGSLGAGGPYGLTMGALFGAGMIAFVKMLIQVLKTYAVSYVARAMILGLAPIFFVFLLFDKTKQLFISWLNLIINLCLQPLLLFTFLSFFLVMVESATKEMLNTELCWGDFRNIEGSTNKLAFWRFKDPQTKQIVTGDYTWEGALECLISNEKQKCKEFPIDIISLLSFLLLIFIMSRFANVVTGMAAELSNAAVNLDSVSKFEQYMQQQGSKSTSANKSAGGVAKP